jgi:copper transporter 1
MGGMRAGGGMPVAFDFGCEVTLFFDAWATSTAFQYLVALVGVFTLCIAQERLFYFRTSLRLGEGVFAREDLSAPIVPKPYSVPNVRQRSLGTFLYGANLVSSYLVMLAVMTCNFGVFVSVVAGLASGHFLFASRRPLAAGPTNSEACHPEY